MHVEHEMTTAEKLKIAVKALKSIADLDDVNANHCLMADLNDYAGFDYPGAVKTARETLRKMKIPFEVKVKS